MFGEAKLGATIALAHYISCLIVGIILRFYNPKVNNQDVNPSSSKSNNIFVRAFNDLYQARRNDGRTLGQLIGDSIKESVNTLLLIGGFIILFSVLTEILTKVGFTKLISSLLLIILKPFGFDQSLTMPIISGLFEITNGSHLASQTMAPLSQKIIITSGIIAWSGFSVHAQVATMINGTDLRMKPYIIARVLHAVLASIATFFLFEPMEIISSHLTTPVTAIPQNFNYTIGYWQHLSQVALGLILLLGLLTCLSLIIYCIKQLKIISFHYFS